MLWTACVLTRVCLMTCDYVTLRHVFLCQWSQTCLLFIYSNIFQVANCSSHSSRHQHVSFVITLWNLYKHCLNRYLSYPCDKRFLIDKAQVIQGTGLKYSFCCPTIKCHTMVLYKSNHRYFVFRMLQFVRISRSVVHIRWLQSANSLIIGEANDTPRKWVAFLLFNKRARHQK